MKLKSKILKNLTRFAKKVCSLVLATGLLLASCGVTSWAATGIDYYTYEGTTLKYEYDDINMKA